MSEAKAAPSGGKKKNQKKVTVSLQQFNNSLPEHDPQSQWGDIDINEEEEFESREQSSNSAQGSSDSYQRRFENRREPQNYREQRDNRDSRDNRDNYQRDNNRQPRERKSNEIPDHPPYVAYVGNLSYSVTREELLDFFSENCAVEDVRLIVDVNSPDKRSKGYGYITFKSREDLETALTANDHNLGGRPIRVDVSTPRDNQSQSSFNRNNDRNDRNDRNNDRGFKKESRFEPSRADNADTWERGRVVAKQEAAPRKEYSKPQNDDRRERRNNNNYRRDNRDNEQKEEETKERTPLKLQPKSSEAPVEANESSSKPNPFGAAKPRDEKAFEERRQKELAERAAQEPKETEEKADVKEEKKNEKYRPPRGNNQGKPFNNNNNRYNNNNNNNNRNQKKKSGPRAEVQADSDGFVPTSKNASSAQSAQSSTTTPASGPSIKNKFSALSDN